MTPRVFPFTTQDVFFMSLQARRQVAVVPNNYQVNVAIGLQMGMRTDRALEVGLEMTSTGDDTPVSFSAKVIGIFKADDDYTFPAPDELRLFLDEFVTQRAVGILWAYSDITIRHLLTNLGANVVKLLPEVNPPSVLGSSIPIPVPLPLDPG